MQWTHKPGNSPQSMPAWFATLEPGDEPMGELHPWQLAQELKTETGDKPSVRTTGAGALVAVVFHANLSLAKRAVVEALIASHDGASSMARDAQAAAAAKVNWAARREQKKALRAKVEANQVLTAADRVVANELYLLGV